MFSASMTLQDVINRIMQITDENIDVKNLVVREQATQQQTLEPSTLCKGLTKVSIYNRLSQTVDITYNPYIPNIGAISGALITLGLSIPILNFQCEDCARDRIDIWYRFI